MAERMRVLGVKAVVVDGRVRDLGDLGEGEGGGMAVGYLLSFFSMI